MAIPSKGRAWDNDQMCLWLLPRQEGNRETMADQFSHCSQQQIQIQNVAFTLCCVLYVQLQVQITISMVVTMERSHASHHHRCPQRAALG
jgi:hypothetical protein